MDHIFPDELLVGISSNLEDEWLATTIDTSANIDQRRAALNVLMSIRHTSKTFRRLIEPVLYAAYAGQEVMSPQSYYSVLSASLQLLASPATYA